ncbi:helix-turn-helix domain-containing protein [Sphingomonas crocodyli]|uniref:DUF4019 domain-containing protein n=1 Tax=Sphingomonas crocodyli TaxID=1979270 RepID=A0A437M8J2_9SPHN|nr:DUF4019 domain-containing protein [Sphingomonas crocodyli]RVT93923.1 DUF4019 domain-containing protein [Sphingomonas crocodyli]
MNIHVQDGLRALTEKEKETLRLIVRGHDAKSTARSLGLSVHTINERLRDARRKMAVSSSREAARLLMAAEGDNGGDAAGDRAGGAVVGSGAGATPDLLGDRFIGEDAGQAAVDQGAASIGGARRAFRRNRIIIGVCLMTAALSLLVLATLPNATSVTSTVTTISAQASTQAPNAEVVETARQWLTLLDQGRWDESYRKTGSQFRKQNTLQMWTDASEQARVPLGAVISRTFVSQQDLPAPPNGYQVVKFRTRFANRDETVETVSLERENGGWQIVAVIIGE